MTTVAIIIPALDRWDLTERCLDSLRVNTGQRFELILVDNASRDHTAQLEAVELADRSGSANARVIRNQTNHGYAVACNQGAAVTTAEVVVFLNTDTEVYPGWLQPMLAALKRPKIALAGSYLTYSNGSIQHAGVEFYRGRGEYLAVNIREWRPSGLVPAVTGACMAVDHKVFDEVGGFDAGFYNGYDDVDLCLAVRDAGYHIWYCADSHVTHHESQSDPAQRSAKLLQNVNRLQEKWGHLAAAPPKDTAVLIPAMRPHLFEGLAQGIETTAGPAKAYFMVGTPEGEKECSRLGVSWFRDEGGTWGERLNYMAQHTTEPYLFLGADDVIFHPTWLNEAQAKMGENDGIVFVADRQNPSGTLALVSRMYLNQWSGCLDQPDVLIHPGYHHNFSECELREVGNVRKRCWLQHMATVEHVHWLTGRAEKDEVYELGQSRWDDDERLFRERAAMWVRPT